MTGRNVAFYNWEKMPGTSALGGKFEKTLAGQGVFLGFGVDFEELTNGVGQYTTALIETASGEVKEVPAGMIQFLPTDTTKEG